MERAHRRKEAELHYCAARDIRLRRARNFWILKAQSFRNGLLVGQKRKLEGFQDENSKPCMPSYVNVTARRPAVYIYIAPQARPELSGSSLCHSR